MASVFFLRPPLWLLVYLEPWENYVSSFFQHENQDIVLLGETRDELGGSEWLARCHGIERGAPPKVDLNHELRLQAFLQAQIAAGAICSAHDCSEGGLAVALAECCMGEKRVYRSAQPFS